VHSERLTYRPVEPSDLDAFSSLVQDAHLEKLGFERFATRPGAFADMPFFRLTGDPLPPRRR
jgi:hypothetical protein